MQRLDWERGVEPKRIKVPAILVAAYPPLLTPPHLFGNVPTFKTQNNS
jgi:hypothetical protein